MTGTVSQYNFAHAGTALLKSAAVSALILFPALLAALYLIESREPVQDPSLVTCIVLLLTALDFLIVVMIEPHLERVSPLTLPAFAGAMAVVLLFAATETLNRIFEHLGYGLLTPFLAVGMLLIYAAVFHEKSIALKCYLSLNSVALMFLWAMGAANKVTLPF